MHNKATFSKLNFRKETMRPAWALNIGYAWCARIENGCSIFCSKKMSLICVGNKVYQLIHGKCTLKYFKWTIPTVKKVSLLFVQFKAKTGFVLYRGNFLCGSCFLQRKLFEFYYLIYGTACGTLEKERVKSIF